MHSTYSLSFTGSLVCLGIVLALIALAIFTFVKLVNHIGALKTFALGFGVFLVGIVGLSVMVFFYLASSDRQMEVTHANVTPNDLETAAAGESMVRTIRNKPRSHSDAMVPSDVPSTEVLAEEPTTSAWDEDVVAVASVYPSIPDCGRPLAAQLVKELQKENESKEELPKAEAEATKKYRIALKHNLNSSLKQNHFLNFVINFRKEFTASFPGSLVDDMSTQNSPATKEKEKGNQYERLDVSVSQSGSEHYSGGWGGVQPRSGQIVCKLTRNDSVGQLEFVSDFIEKPWITDSQKFMSQHSNRKFVIGFSPRLATSQYEARVGALKDANVRLTKSSSMIFRPGYDIEESVADRFVQKLTMPYGSVWREAVLLDYESYKSPNTSLMKFSNPDAAIQMAVIGRNAVTASAPTAENRGLIGSLVPSRTRSINPESAIAGLMLLTVAVGWISNWMTQGYYRRPVWTITGTVFSIGLFILIFFVLISVA